LVNKNLTGYFWYAVGEIGLVVLGILIALQINNWNEERIEQNQIREYALSLIGDLQRDLQMPGPVNGQKNIRVRRAHQASGSGLH